MSNSKKRIIIGIIGPFGSGKTLVADYFTKRGFTKIKLSDFVRQAILKSNDLSKTDRQTLQDVGNQLRQKHGAFILAKLALDLAKEKKAHKVVIDGIRNIAEINYLKRQGKSLILGVTAQSDTRFSRLQKLKKKKFDSKNEFRRLDIREQGKGQTSTGLQLNKCWQMKDYEVNNNSSKKSLYLQVENFLSYIKNGHARLVLLGSPGSGKGTQGELLSKKLHLPRLSVGALIRRHMVTNTKQGIKAKSYVLRGIGIPANIYITMLGEWILSHQQGFIIDNLIRTRSQLAAFKQFQEKHMVSLDKVFYLKVSKKESLKRLEKRNGENLRGDETPEAVLKRFETFFHSVNVILEYFREQGIVEVIDADRKVDIVHKDIMSRIDKA